MLGRGVSRRSRPLPCSQLAAKLEFIGRPRLSGLEVSASTGSRQWLRQTCTDMDGLRLITKVGPQRALNNLLIARTLFEREAPQVLMLHPRQMEGQRRWISTR